MPKEGIFARVLHSGNLKPGETFEYHPKVFKVQIITLSDRAFSNEYEDRSGPRIRERLETYFATANRPFSVVNTLIPDDPHQLNDILHAPGFNGNYWKAERDASIRAWTAAIAGAPGIQAAPAPATVKRT